MHSPLKLASSVLTTLTCVSAISLMALSVSAQPIGQPQTAREIHKTESKSVSATEATMLNPQPLPPKQNGFKQNPGDKVSLNPQPLPPKQGVPQSSLSR